MKYNSRFLFRIWSLQRKRWEPLVNYNLDFLPNYEQNDIIVQQCTGLKDSKGIDIYEGDIVRFKERPHTSERGEFEDSEGYEWDNVLVFWDKKEYGFRFKLNNYRNSEKIRYESIKVIGNVFENKELLTK